MKSKSGKIVSKRRSLFAKKRYASTIGKWIAAVTKARKAVGVKGFMGVKKLYSKAKSFFKNGSPFLAALALHHLCVVSHGRLLHTSPHDEIPETRRVS
eukprot:NODE_29987_length_430_cov_1.910891.p1 GENE.NODE_29987_length_430_cov_1.910891~~NODE_29987_length_430_cov_1.910891.p1  ORF type:complete len:98 (+),score=12.90 NODE_29987_length_430_cov_1.910891:134-427(+)